MSDARQQDLLPELGSRREYFDYLEGFVEERSMEMLRRRTKRPFVKSFLFETVRSSQEPTDDLKIMRCAGLELHPIDETLFAVRLPGKGIGGLLELLLPRHPVFYSTLPSDELNGWARSLIHASPALDRVWLSAALFEVLWEHVRATTSPSRFSRLTFEHEARYEVEDTVLRGGEVASDVDEADGEELDADNLETEDPEAETGRPERRSSRSTFVERIGTIEGKLKQLRDVYRPFCSVVQLRIPGAVRGGHDFYYDGRVTNKSDSFAEHRATLSFVLSLYRRSTESAEERLWMSTEGADQTGTAPYKLHGAPVVMSFSERLTDAVFARWMAHFAVKKSRFRIWGNPIQVSESQFHVYGVDRHLWQPVYLEMSPSHVIAVLPKGTCGNTVHRLVSNIQRFVDPAVETWIGDRPYADFVRQAKATSEQRSIF